ncbi:MAG: HAMP domain-containing sensor histidine kinase [bacterium]
MKQLYFKLLTYLSHNFRLLFSFKEFFDSDTYISYQTDLLNRVFFVELLAFFYFIFFFLFIDPLLSSLVFFVLLLELTRFFFVRSLYLKQLLHIFFPCVAALVFIFCLGPVYSLTIFPYSLLVLSFTFCDFKHPLKSLFLLSISISTVIFSSYLVELDALFTFSSFSLHFFNYSMYGWTTILILTPLKFTYDLTQLQFIELIDTNNTLRSTIKESQKKSLYIEKLSQQNAFSRLSKGIAHEIRNPMMGLMGNLELLERQPKNKAAFSKLVLRSQKCIDRMLNITNVMLKYGNPEKSTSKSTHISQLVQEVLSLSENKCLQHGIHIKTHFDSIDAFFVDQTLLFQILSNLISNAIDAMSDLKLSKEKTLSVTTSLSMFQNTSHHLVDGLQIVIQDTGCGISKKDLNQVLDPFYSKKYNHVGLGLSIVLKSVRSLNGILDIRSEVDQGTSVIINIPHTTANNTPISVKTASIS